MKKAAGAIITGAAVIAGLLISYSVLNPELRQTVVQPGTALTLSAEQELNQKTAGAHLDWDNGTMKITETGVQAFDSFERAGIRAADMGSTETEKGEIFLLISLHIKNLDASSEGSDYINLRMFGPVKKNDFYKKQEGILSSAEKLSYLDSHTKGSEKYQDRYYFYVHIPKGKEIDCKIGIFANGEDYRKDRLLLKVGVDSPVKYAFLLKKEG